MDYDTVPKAAIVFSVVAVIIAAAAVTMVATDGDDDRYRIYIGMDGDTTQSQMDSVESQMKNLISGDHRMGYTMYWADGAYVDDGEVFENRTLVIILLDANGSDERIGRGLHRRRGPGARRGVLRGQGDLRLRVRTRHQLRNTGPPSPFFYSYLRN